MKNLPLRYWLVLALGLALSGLPSGPVQAQSTPPEALMAEDISELDPIFLLWARNIARRAAEAENGGLTNYVAEAAMHGPTTQAPMVINEDGSLTFTFRGYRPENIDLNGNPTYSFETEVLVNPNRTFEIVYNGPIRPTVPESEKF